MPHPALLCPISEFIDSCVGQRMSHWQLPTSSIHVSLFLYQRPFSSTIATCSVQMQSPHKSWGLTPSGTIFRQSGWESVNQLPPTFAVPGWENSDMCSTCVASAGRQRAWSPLVHRGNSLTDSLFIDSSPVPISFSLLPQWGPPSMYRRPGLRVGPIRVLFQNFPNWGRDVALSPWMITEHRNPELWVVWLLQYEKLKTCNKWTNRVQDSGRGSWCCGQPRTQPTWRLALFWPWPSHYLMPWASASFELGFCPL